MGRPENMTVVLAVPIPSERRRREPALAGLLITALEMLLNAGDTDLEIRIETAKDVIREFKHAYPEPRQI